MCSEILSLAPIITPAIEPTVAISPAITPLISPMVAPTVTPQVAVSPAVISSGVTTTPIPPTKERIPWLDSPSYFDEDKKELKKGIITWRQGLFWRYLEPPNYDELKTSKTALPGTHKFAVGEDSAYKTIQVINGLPDRDIKQLDIGIALVSITRKGKELEINFKRDEADAYKGADIKEQITTLKAKPKGVPDFTRSPDGRIQLVAKPKIKLNKPRPTPFFSEDTVAPQRAKKKDEVGVSSDRYYLGHKLPDANITIPL